MKKIHLHKKKERPSTERNKESMRIKTERRHGFGSCCSPRARFQRHLSVGHRASTFGQFICMSFITECLFICMSFITECLKLRLQHVTNSERELSGR